MVIDEARISTPLPDDRTPNARRSAVTLRELEVFQAIVETGTATNAARRLGLSQPAVSRAVAQLEAQLAKPLFERSGGRLLPTAHALAIAAEVGPLFVALERITQAAQERPSGHEGELTIAASPTIAHRFLPPFVASFAKAHPRLDLRFEIVSSDVLVTSVAEGRFDVALTDNAVHHQGVQSELLLETSAICVMPAQHRLAGRLEVTPEDLDGEPFVALTRRHSGRAAVDRIFDQAGVRPKIAIEAATVVSALEFVRHGLGIAILNPMAIQRSLDPSVTALPFAPAIAYRASFLLPASRPCPPAVADFMSLVSAGAGEAVPAFQRTFP